MRIETVHVQESRRRHWTLMLGVVSFTILVAVYVADAIFEEREVENFFDTGHKTSVSNSTSRSDSAAGIELHQNHKKTRASPPTPAPTTQAENRNSSHVIDGLFARSMFPMKDVRSEVTDFSILDTEGWNKSVIADTGPTFGAHLRRKQRGWQKIKHAVVLIAGGKSSYLHFAISTCSNIRINGYAGDIFVYLQVSNSDVDGCVASYLRRMGVQVLPFDELMPNFEHPKNRNRSPAWFKLGLVWNERMREYDRIFFFDTDQFININIEEVITREISANVAIAMCAMECVKHSFIGIDPTCDWDCAKNNQRFQRPRVKYDTCDNMLGDVDRQRVNSDPKTRDLFWSHFPRKSIAYISGVWLLDNTKLPSIEETRFAAESLFVHLDPAWKAFGDQGFFANYFYDNSAILPECHLSNPKAWDHVFHNHVDSAVGGGGQFGPRFKQYYKNATGLDRICRGGSFDGELYQD